MISNLKKYKNDLTKLIDFGNDMLLRFEIEIQDKLKNKLLEGKTEEEKDCFLQELKNLPSIDTNYQHWYSESLVLLKQLLPERIDDFISQYKKPKKERKTITLENYVIEDGLIGLEVSKINHFESKELIVDKKAILPKLQQQLNIIKSIEKRFESSLFDIKQLVQADLFDSELGAAKELNKKGFTRGAGAIAGVVLEGHLSQACDNHNLIMQNKNPTINDFAQLLKDNNIIETHEWRKIQHLADLRNICDHKKKSDPETVQIDELIEGVAKIIKTLF